MRDALFGQGTYEETPAMEGLGGVSGGFPAEGVGGGVNKYMIFRKNHCSQRDVETRGWNDSQYLEEYNIENMYKKKKMSKVDAQDQSSDETGKAGEARAQQPLAVEEEKEGTQQPLAVQEGEAGTQDPSSPANQNEQNQNEEKQNEEKQTEQNQKEQIKEKLKEDLRNIADSPDRLDSIMEAVGVTDQDKKGGGRRRSTRRRHKKSGKKSRRQSKKGGKKHRKSTNKKGDKSKKRSQRKH